MGRRKLLSYYWLRERSRITRKVGLGEILTDDLAEDIDAAWEHPSAVEDLLSELASIRGPVHLS